MADEEDIDTLRLLLGIMLFFLLIAYVVSPHDLVPESRYGAVGLIDDAFVLVILFVMMNAFVATPASAMFVLLLGLVLIAPLANIPAYPVGYVYVRM